MDKRLRLGATGAAVLGLTSVVAALTSRFHPTFSPFRSDLLTLTNDVGEKIVVLKSTVKPEAKTGKELLKSIAEDVKEDIKNSSKPVTRSEVTSCLEADSKASEADSTQSVANSWRENMFGSSLADMYDQQAQEARRAAAEKESECTKGLNELKKERDRLKADASASKQLISLSGSPGSHEKYVPTYSYKLLVTDVNGKSNVIPRQVTCLNENAVNIFSREKRKSLAPQSFVAFSKPGQMTIVTGAELLPEISRYGGAVIPTEDAMNYASQQVCSSKGHVGVEPDLSPAK
jgi:hypothetical protein